MAAPIVIVGSLNMDVVCRVARAPGAGETVMGDAARFVPGGKGANQAVAAARLGGDVSMVGRVGADDSGSSLRAGLVQEGIDVSHVSVDDAISSGMALILVEANGQNRITVAPGANAALTAAHVAAAAAGWSRGGILLLQLETPLDTVAAAIDAAGDAGLTVILNPAPAQSLPDAWWKRIDILVPNESEAAMLAGVQVVDEDSARHAARILRQRGARCVLVTLAERGALIVDGDGERVVAAPRVTAVDTTAAGDTFIGALAVALSEDASLDAATHFAVEAAALSVTRPGAQPSIPRRAELGAIDPGA
jgi:ribokinase